MERGEKEENEITRKQQTSSSRCTAWLGYFFFLFHSRATSSPGRKSTRSVCREERERANGGHRSDDAQRRRANLLIIHRPCLPTDQIAVSDLRADPSAVDPPTPALPIFNCEYLTLRSRIAQGQAGESSAVCTTSFEAYWTLSKASLPLLARPGSAASSRNQPYSSASCLLGRFYDKLFSPPPVSSGPSLLWLVQCDQGHHHPNQPRTARRAGNPYSLSRSEQG